MLRPAGGRRHYHSFVRLVFGYVLKGGWEQVEGEDLVDLWELQEVGKMREGREGDARDVGGREGVRLG